MPCFADLPAEQLPLFGRQPVGATRPAVGLGRPRIPRGLAATGARTRIAQLVAQFVAQPLALFGIRPTRAGLGKGSRRRAEHGQRKCGSKQPSGMMAQRPGPAMGVEIGQ